MADNEWFDWVQARAQCNVSTVFGKLRTIVERDVKAAVECGIEAEVIDGDLSDTLSVRVNREPNILTGVRTFSVEGDELRVVDLRRSSKVMLVGNVKFDGKDCLIEVDKDGSKQCLLPWEFSRLALEPLFFPRWIPAAGRDRAPGSAWVLTQSHPC